MFRCYFWPWTPVNATGDTGLPQFVLKGPQVSGKGSTLMYHPSPSCAGWTGLEWHQRHSLSQKLEASISPRPLVSYSAGLHQRSFHLILSLSLFIKELPIVPLAIAPIRTPWRGRDSVCSAAASAPYFLTVFNVIPAPKTLWMLYSQDYLPSMQDLELLLHDISCTLSFQVFFIDDKAAQGPQ